MRTIYSIILSKFTRQSLIPILVIEVSLVIALFILNEYQATQNKDALVKITKETFSGITHSTAKLITKQFAKEKEILSILQKSSQQYFSYKENPENFLDDEFVYDSGFFRYVLDKNSTKSSIYTTNITKLTHDDFIVLNSLIHLYPILQSSVDLKDDLISSAWINIGSNYTLVYPEINILNEVSPNLDVTQYPFYYLADKAHNPLKQSVFIPLYTEPWAMELGEIGAYVIPLYTKENMIGVVGLTLHVDALYDSIKMMNLPAHTVAIVLDDKNHIILSSDSKRVEDLFHTSSFYQHYMDKNSTDLAPVNLSSLQDVISYESNISQTSLKLFIFSSKKDVFKNISKIHSNTVYVGIAFVVLIFLFYMVLFFYARKKIKLLADDISYPLKNIVEFSGMLGQSQEDRLADSDIKELSELLANLNQTHNHLLDMIIYDEQTHIYNRRKLLLDIDKIETLLIFSIHNYKSLQYIYGEEVATQLLLGVCESIKNQKGITPYRLYEDEFALALEGYDLERLQTLCNEMKQKNMCIEGIRFHPTLFGGVATREEGQNLFEASQTALLFAKKNLVSNFVEYKDAVGIEDEFKENIKWSTKINEALLHKKLEPYFQAVYDIKNKKINKFEALVRMNDDGQVIPPFFFLDAAKSIGRLHDITRFMVSSVMKVASKYPKISFNINISFKDFDDKNFLDYILQKCQINNVNPENITFELLETDALENSDIAISCINQLKSKGFQIAIDDFGSGNSNFAHLMAMRVDYIKIDGQFIKDITKNPHSANIAQTITKFSALVGAKCVAEYVCDKNVLKRVTQLGIDYAQGYEISKPVRADMIDELINREFE